MNIGRIALLSAAVGAFAVGCVPPPPTHLCPNGGASAVPVISGVACPPGGWYVRDDGTRSQTFPYGAQLPGVKGAEGIRFTHTFFRADGTLRLAVTVTGPRFMWSDTVIETRDGFAIDSPPITLPVAL